MGLTGKKKKGKGKRKKERERERIKGNSGNRINEEETNWIREGNEREGE